MNQEHYPEAKRDYYCPLCGKGATIVDVTTINCEEHEWYRVSLECHHVTKRELAGTTMYRSGCDVLWAAIDVPDYY